MIFFRNFTPTHHSTEFIILTLGSYKMHLLLKCINLSLAVFKDLWQLFIIIYYAYILYFINNITDNIAYYSNIHVIKFIATSCE